MSIICHNHGIDGCFSVEVDLAHFWTPPHPTSRTPWTTGVGLQKGCVHPTGLVVLRLTWGIQGMALDTMGVVGAPSIVAVQTALGLIVALCNVADGLAL